MKKIGIVVAIDPEMQALQKRLGKPKEIIKTASNDVMEYEKDNCMIYACKCDAGEIASSACTQLLISLFNVDYIFNFGVVGGLTEEMCQEKTCFIEKVVHYDFDTSEIDDCEVARYLILDDIWIPVSKDLLEEALKVEPNIKAVRCASADKFVADKEKKEELYKQYGAEICDMESAGIALTCYRNHIPCFFVKTISDGLNDGALEFHEAIHEAALKCFDIFDKIINNMSL